MSQKPKINAEEPTESIPESKSRILNLEIDMEDLEEVDEPKKKPVDSGEHRPTRQQRWQWNKQSNQQCVVCGKPAVNRWHCQEHKEKHAIYQRDRYRAKHNTPGRK